MRKNLLRKVRFITKYSYKTIPELLKETTCNNDELYKYLSKNVGTEAADNFVKNGKWPDGIQIPKNPSVLKADGAINWSAAAKGGYKLDSDGNAIKTVLTDAHKVNEYLPQGKILDRYGDSSGRYVSPVNNGVPYSYEQRSLPYIEDASNYHQYEVKGDFSRLKDYINNCSDTTLKNEIMDDIDYYYNGDFSKVVVNVGEIAKVDGWGIGEGIQYEFPIKVEYLVKLGLLKEIK
ncbi:TNT domain-containing protein [Anaerocolumna sp. AGMB13020]|uniref:TNT domain-containing protein n=1 Tax=Anaerocolumna sp. AGMB13020 TaxID=3081750 RepID=UPI002954D72D|nr:TNT domain-containing protein [Anaerocolumna sp. AGMB13020]WOO36602.1 TNT domain-containing protein [Anaerocolumna sp. AGMB13020]